jgi:hypothetical protein
MLCKVAVEAAVEDARRGWHGVVFFVRSAREQDASSQLAPSDLLVHTQLDLYRY